MMMRKSLTAALCLILPLFGAVPAHAQEGGLKVYEISLGLLDHDTDNLWSGFSREEGVDLNAEMLLSPVGSLFNGDFHPAIGLSVNSGDDTSKAYAGLRWRYELEGGVFFGLGLGAAIHDGETETRAADKKELGSRVLFHIPAEVGYRFTENYTASLYFDPISNAYLADQNEGLDTLGLRIGYRF